MTETPLDEVAAAFGADLDTSIPLTDDVWVDVAAITELPASARGGSVVAERDGIQGVRPEVLRPASRRGAAASVMWNADGMVVFACARRGKVLYSRDVSMEEDPDGLPKPLRPLLRLADDDDADLVAIAMAMLEQFTGVEVTASMVMNVGVGHPIISPAIGDLAQVDPSSSMLRYDRPDLVDAIAAATPQTRRALAEWAALQAARQIGIDDDPRVEHLTSQFGGAAPATMSVGLALLLADFERESLQASNAHWREFGEDVRGLEASWMRQRSWCVGALRHACQLDDLSAALGAVDSAGGCLRNDGHQDAFYDEASHLIELPLSAWATQGHRVPDPPTKEARAAALEQDRAKRARRAQFDELEAYVRARTAGFDDVDEYLLSLDSDD